MSKSNSLSSLNTEGIQSSTEPEESDQNEVEKPPEEPEPNHQMPEKCKEVAAEATSSDNEIEIDEDIIRSTAGRLSVRQRTKLDKVYEKFEKPEGHVPPTAFPGWSEWSMNQKLPQYPFVASDFWTREMIGNDLKRPKKVDPVFHIDDENNMERVPVPMTFDTYTALHDPALASYLKRPEVLERLRSHGLVTEENRVVCTQREFNNFRNYLRTLWADDIKKEIAIRDQCARQKIIQDRWIKQYQNINYCEHELKKAVAKQRKCDDYLEKVKKIQDSIRMKEERWKRARQIRECGQLEKILAQAEREKCAAEARKMANDYECARRRELVMRIVGKEKSAMQRLARDKKMAKECAQQYKCEWLDSKWEAQAERSTREQNIRFSLRADQKRRAKQRQTQVEYYRKNMPTFLERRKREQDRVREIVAKYFYRWLNKCRERKQRQPDELHTSLWDIKNSVDDTNEYLKEQSGYENMDDFVMSIMKMDKGMKERLSKARAGSGSASGRSSGRSSRQITAEGHARK